jgi:hypothetical protein
MATYNITASEEEEVGLQFALSKENDRLKAEFDSQEQEEGAEFVPTTAQAYLSKCTASWFKSYCKQALEARKKDKENEEFYEAALGLPQADRDEIKALILQKKENNE